VPGRLQISGLLTAAVLLLGVAARAAPLPVQASSSTPLADQASTRAAAKSLSTQNASAAPVTDKPLLPSDFASEPREGGIVIDPSAASADSAHAGVLNEDGFLESSNARYAGAGAAGYTVQVLRFGDATGAFSAFTFYRNPDMHPEKVGDNAASSPAAFLVRAGAMLVRVLPSASGSTGMVHSSSLLPAIQALVVALPRVHGPEGIAPLLPSLLPAPGLASATVHYAIGSAGYNGPIPAAKIDFSRDAEAVTAEYRLSSGSQAILTLLMLPTPQIAGSQLRAIQALPNAALHVATHRSGTLVEAVSGAGVSPKDAQTLLSEISYVSDVTIDQPQGYISEVAKTAKLLFNIAMFTIMLAIAAVVVAVFLGFGRVWIRRLRGKPDSSVLDDEFIRLKI
jgi:hypothetical protein